MLKHILLASLFAAAAPALGESRQAHWRSEISGGPVPGKLTSETWIKGDRVRMVLDSPAGPSVMIVKGDTAYMTMGKTALKMPVDTRTGASPRPADYVNGLDKLLEGGKKLQGELVDGEFCEKWQVIRNEGGVPVETTLWVSIAMRFPRKVVVKTDRGDVVMRNKDIELGIKLDDAFFEPDPSLRYEDAAESIRRQTR